MIENIEANNNTYRGQLGRPAFVVGKEGVNEGFLIDYYYGPYKAPSDHTKWKFEYSQNGIAVQMPNGGGTFSTSLEYNKAVAEYLLKNVNQWQIGRKICIIDDDETPIEYVVKKDNNELKFVKVYSEETIDPTESNAYLTITKQGDGSIEVYDGLRVMVGAVEQPMEPTTDGKYKFTIPSTQAIVGCRIKPTQGFVNKWVIHYPDGTSEQSQDGTLKVSFNKGVGNYSVSVLFGTQERFTTGTVDEEVDVVIRRNIYDLLNLNYNTPNSNNPRNIPNLFENSNRAIEFMKTNFGKTTFGSKSSIVPLEGSIVDNRFVNALTQTCDGLILDTTSKYELTNLYDLSIRETNKIIRINKISFDKKS